MSASAAVILTMATMACLFGDPTDGAPRIRASGTAEVVYVANEGFLLLLNGRKILVDGLYQLADPVLPAPTVRDMVENGRPPFDDVDLILATHAHPDHFLARSVVTYLRRSPRAVFVGPPQAVRQLRDSVSDLGPLEARIETVDVPLGGTAELDVAGIRILIMGARHSGMPDVQNYMYLVEWRGFKAFHEGDAPTGESLAPWGLAEKDVDVAFFHFGRLFRPGGMSVRGTSSPCTSPTRVLRSSCRGSKSASRTSRTSAT
jgi:L-ascorbate metabolism protein UlaG (beta-lactamase superfamily)